MRSFQIKSSELAVVPERNPLVLRTYLQPLTKKQGWAFGLIRLLGQKTELRERIADVIVEHLEILASVSGEQQNIPRKFEQTLQQINKSIFELTQSGPSISLADLHAVIGVLVDDQLFISGVGSLSAVFMHRTAKQRYVIYELDRQFRDESSWEKPFVTILDGEFAAGDVFYLATKASQREIGPADLQEILVTLPPSGSLPRIQQHLHRDSAYGAVCFQVVEQEASKGIKKENPLSSIESLTKTTEQTASLLGEQSPEISSYVNKLTKPILKKLSAPGTSGAKTTLKRLTKTTLQLLSGAAIFLLSLAKRIVEFVKERSNQSRSAKKSSERVAAEPKPSLKERASSMRGKIRSVPMKSKILTGGALIIALLLFGTIFLTQKNKDQSEQDQANQAILLRIEEKKNAAEASLIYNDTNQAKNLVAEAIDLLDSLPSNDETLDSDINRLRNELNDVLSSIRGISSVATTDIGNFAAVSDGSIATSTIVNGVFYVVSDKNEVFRFNDLTQSWDRVETTNGTLVPIKESAPENDNLLVVDLSKNLGRADMTALSLNPITSGVNALASVEDIETYGGNLYALTASGKQIVKMRPQGTGYDAGTPWIVSANVDLSKAQALAIDGNVYILTNSTIAKFLSGKEQAFTLAAVEPVLTGATDLFTAAESDYLYVLDPVEGRVIVYKKDGSLVTQYLADTFKDAIAMTVVEQKNLIYVTTPTKVVSFPAKHLLQ